MESLVSNMLKGVAKLVVAYGDTLNDEQFVARLSKVSVREIIRTAKERHAGTQGYAEALLMQYNKRLKYPLRWNSLRDNPEEHVTSTADCTTDNLQLCMEHSFWDGHSTDEVTGEENPEYDDYDEEIPDHEDALQNQILMDNLSLRDNRW